MDKTITSFAHMYGGVAPKSAEPITAERGLGTVRYALPAHRGPTSVSGPFGVLRRLARAFVLWNSVRETRDALLRMDDRMLDDIGLSRPDIDAVSREAGRRMQLWGH